MEDRVKVSVTRRRRGKTNYPPWSDLFLESAGYRLQKIPRRRTSSFQVCKGKALMEIVRSLSGDDEEKDDRNEKQHAKECTVNDKQCKEDGKDTKKDYDVK